MSFKYGSFEGMRNGRYFTDMTEEKLNGLPHGWSTIKTILSVPIPYFLLY